MLSPNIQVAALFTTPLLTERWSGFERHNEALRDAILERRRSDPGVTLSNVHGWQSDDRMLHWGGEAARALHDHVVERCTAMTQDVTAPSGPPALRWIQNMWGNVSGNGASNQTHSHPGALWSAVYYVEDGYAGSTDRALGGQLVFLDPRMPMIRAGLPDLRYRAPGGDHDSQEVWLRPESGRLVIFPSWLMHNVRPYLGTGERMSIAINLTPRAAAAA